MIKNKKLTRVVNIGNLKIGGNNPIVIKGMVKTPYSNPKKLIQEVKRLEKEGVEAIRLAVKEEKDIKILFLLRKYTPLPFVADIHFQYRFALKAIDAGFESIRLNPLNIYKKNEVKAVVRLAKARKISIRVGVNSGGFKQDFASPLALGQNMVKEVKEYLRLFEDEGFFDIMVSLKGSDINSTIYANRLFSQSFDYPIHLGITASGPFLPAVIKTSLGLSPLLFDGIGNVIRVSLTAPSFWEIRVAKEILQSLDLRRFGPEIISCPTCSRCEVNLIKIVDEFKQRLAKAKINHPLRIALMGCIVNGPGEAYQADIGVAFGKNKAAIFKKDKILGFSKDKYVVDDLLERIKQIWK